MAFIYFVITYFLASLSGVAIAYCIVDESVKSWIPYTSSSILLSGTLFFYYLFVLEMKKMYKKT